MWFGRFRRIMGAFMSAFNVLMAGLAEAFAKKQPEVVPEFAPPFQPDLEIVAIMAQAALPQPHRCLFFSRRGSNKHYILETCVTCGKLVRRPRPGEVPPRPMEVTEVD